MTRLRDNLEYLALHTAYAVWILAYAVLSRLLGERERDMLG